MPDIKIPTFDGSYLEWDTFHETFDALIGTRTEYTDVKKFQYLRAHLSGPAKQCVEGFPVTGACYVEAYKLLSERFGNEHLVIQAHMKEITKLKGCNNKGTAVELRRILDTISSNIRSLETKGGK